MASGTTRRIIRGRRWHGCIVGGISPPATIFFLPQPSAIAGVAKIFEKSPEKDLTNAYVMPIMLMR